jgi:two-component system nitrogen regulation response regulator NtrX
MSGIDSISSQRIPQTMLGDSSALNRLRERLEHLSRQPHPVLIWGENGAGKTQAALFLHMLAGGGEDDLSKLSCGSLDWSEAEWPEAELDSVFCLLLEEMPSLPRPAQAWLAAWLEEKTTGPRESGRPGVIATANRSPGELLAEGRLTRGLLAHFVRGLVKVPPLRERRQDIPALARHFLHMVAARRGAAPNRLDDEALSQLEAYTWPGNCRELMNAMEYAFLLSRGGTVTPLCLPPLA